MGSQVSDDELLDVLEHLLDALGDYLWVAVLVDAVLTDGNVTSPRIHLGAVNPEAALTENGQLFGLADLDWVGRSEDGLLDLWQPFDGTVGGRGHGRRRVSADQCQEICGKDMFFFLCLRFKRKLFDFT